MDNQKVFCESCREDVEYIGETTLMNGTINGRTYSYPGREIRCAKCGALLFVPEIIDANLDSLYNAFRKEHGNIPRN